MLEGRRLTWFAIARMIVVTLFYASTALLYDRKPDSLESLSLQGLVRLIVATYLFSLLSIAALKLPAKFRPLITYTQIIWDMLLVTVLILLTGGVASPYSFLYMLAIISASVLLARRQSFYVASLCVILYGATIDLQYYGRLVQLGLSPESAQQAGLPYLFYSLFLNITAFYLTALLTGYLAERARASETALHEKEIDYLELERLNSTIVRNLNSGLVTITPKGMVRVFNRFAENLTGVSQQEAYDCHISLIIPGFERVIAENEPVSSGETFFTDPGGEQMIFGYHSVRFYDSEGGFNGIIFNFEDLSRIRSMEEELKRADRLAAIGELSARIAHEIRNPLASISGSVQLISQGDAVPEKDRKLLDIVLRETDRLNLLISDFLTYARPVKPDSQVSSLAEMYTGIEALLLTDPRFSGISIKFSDDYNVRVRISPDHLQQLFWNLLVNAAESMSDGGDIEISGCLVNLAIRGNDNRSFVRIDISDTGKGMSESETSHLFEPFFTTKSNGTGLGLATVYRIVEAHEGRIFVESAPGKGTRISILLPAVETGGDNGTV